MTKTVEFIHELQRSHPVDHVVELAVTAVVRLLLGEPGSASITAGWEIDRIRVDQTGGLFSTVFRFEDLTEAEQREVEEAVIKHAS